VSEDAGVKKRSIVVAGHKTSVSLERAFWDALKAEAETENLSLAALVARVDSARGAANLSSALRVFALTRALERALHPRPR
jgi:predicted DNA-binding ribbon-helix-helix protein